MLVRLADFFQRMLTGLHSVSASWLIWSKANVRILGTLRGAACEWTRSTVGSAATEMAQVDHRVSQSFEGIVDIGDELVTNENPPEFVLPGEHAFDGAKAFLADGRTEHALGSALGGLPATRVLVNVGSHATVEDHLAIDLAIVGAVQADDAPSKIDANGPGDARQFRQRPWQQRGLIAVARGAHERCEYVAVAVAKRDHLVPPEMLVPAEGNVVATLLCDGCRAVTVNDRGVEQVVIEQGLHRTREDGVDTAVGHPTTKRTVDARVVDFGSPIEARLNRQRLPLAPQVELQQDVVEDLVQRQFEGWSAVPTREVGQDKFIKLLDTQTRWNPLPLLAFRHFACQSRRILPDAVGLAQTQCSCGLADNCDFRKTRNQL